MDQYKIDRINELAHIAKQRELTDEELAERAALRKEFLASIRNSLRQQLDRIEFVDDPETVDKNKLS